MRTRASVVVVLAMTLLLAAAATAAACTKTSLPAIENEVMCPICGVPLSVAGGPQAEKERDFIRKRVERCETKPQIKNALVAEYGEEVLAVPSTEGFDLAAYLVPAAAGIAALLGVGIGARRWRREREAERAAIGAEPAGSDKLDKDFERYNL
jgi:cytochrome c-type biogenesis protein CcmH/NrfF